MEHKLQKTAAQLPEIELTLDTIAAKAAVAEKTASRSPWRTVAIWATCLVLLVSIGFGGYAYAAEQKEYKAAVAFFDENGLSTEGLTRREIKAVYRDITTKSFTYSKTAQVIQSSMTQEQIAGFEILQDAPTPKDLEDLWNYIQSGEKFVPYVRNDYHLTLDFITDHTGRVIGEVYYIEKYEKDMLIWRTEIPAWSGGTVEVSDGVIAYVYDVSWDTGTALTEAWIIKLDFAGNICWSQSVDNGFDREYPSGVLENQDGSYTLFSRGDDRYLCVSCYTPQGQQTQFLQTDIGSFQMGQIAHYGDGYLLQITDVETGKFTQFVQMDSQGNVTHSFSYSDDVHQYKIMDMVEWGGKVYVSAYAVPKQDPHSLYPRHEIDSILNVIFRDKKGVITSEELTPMVRQHYTAVLLVCDPNQGGKMETFYTIPGSMGAELIIAEDGRLIWETESITNTFFSMATSSYTIGGQCYVYQTSFDDHGAVIGHVKTDRVTNYRR